MWFDGRELLPQPPPTAAAARPGPVEVLVPFGRQERRGLLVVGSATPGSPCLVLQSWR